MSSELIKPNCLFFDLDESIVKSFYATDEKHADQLLEQYLEYWNGVKFHIRHNGWFVSFLRNTTIPLLQFSRELLGDDNVYILSHGSCDYVRWVNVKLELGFDPNINIFGSEDISYHDTFPKFINTFNVLIDNESYDYHNSTYQRCKVKFLNNLPKSQYIRIDEFSLFTEKLTKKDDDLFVEDMKKQIKNAFNLK